MAVVEVEILMGSSLGDYRLQRFPIRKKETLRAWDAADDYVLLHLAENNLLNENSSILIVNDGFGALSVPLSKYHPVVMTDSYLSVQAISQNVKENELDEGSVIITNTLSSLDDVLKTPVDIVLIKIPKSLAMLEDELYRIRPVIGASTKVIAAGMTRNIHMSVMALFEKIIGPTKTSLARKKARLIFSEYDANLEVADNPYPQTYQSGYKLEDVDLEISNYAGVFSREKLDIGTRLFIENLPVDEKYTTIADLGCGNGIVGLMAAIKNPLARLIFTDESYVSVESSINNFISVFEETRDAEFLQTDCLQGVAESSVSLVLCNPPFHQNNAINDDVAWQMFTEAKLALEDKGELWVIGNRHLGYHAKLKHLFGECDVVASNKKFTLFKATK